MSKEMDDMLLIKEHIFESGDFDEYKKELQYDYNELAQFYAYKIYSDMTDGNTFVVSPDKEKAKRYGKELYNIY